MEVKWNDGINSEFTEDLSVNPSSGSGDKTVTVSGLENTKLDREALIDVETNTGGKKATVKVSQKGQRKAFCTGDGIPFLTGDSASYNVIPPDCIVFDKSISDPANITGYGTSGIMDLCSKWRRCLVKTTAPGEVAICYLKDDNSNFYHDGTPAILTGAEGDVMVYQPDIYYKYQNIGGDKFGYNISNTPIEGGQSFNRSLIGAYKGYIKPSGGGSGGGGSRELRSISGVAPTVSKTIDEFKKAASSGSSSSFGWDIIDYHQHCVIALMFYAKYGTRDAQAVLGSGGAMYDSNNTTGNTNLIGNADTQNETANYVNFLGIEGEHGGIYEWVSGVTINNLVWTIPNPDGTTRDVTAFPDNGWIMEIAASVGPYFDLIPTRVGGSATTYYSDYYYQNTGSRVLARSCSSADADGGVSCAAVYYGASYEFASCGSRLAFHGKINVIDDPAEFISLPVRL